MSQPLPLDFLLVCRPRDGSSELVEALLTQWHVGRVTMTRADGSGDISPELERVTLSSIEVTETLSRVEMHCTLAHHRRPVFVGMHPDTIARLAQGLTAAQLLTARTGTLSLDVHALASSAERLWCLRWVTGLMGQLAQALDAIIFAPAAQRFYTAQEFQHAASSSPLVFVTLHDEPWGPEQRWLHTHGLQYFAQPELEMVAVPQSLVEEATGLMHTVVMTLVAGADDEDHTPRAGMEIDCEGIVRLYTRTTRPDGDHSARFGRLRLVTAPPPGLVPGDDATDALITASAAAANEALTANNLPLALRHLDRALSASPQHPDALAGKARYYMAATDFPAALDLAMAMDLHAPQDYRGQYFTGLALVALDRHNEALHAFNRAINLAPDHVEPLLARAHLLDRFGQTQAAAADRARAAVMRDE